MVTPKTRLTYADLDARANRVAHHLADTGIRAGDHVGVMLRNGAEYLEMMLGCFKLSAVPININYRYVQLELAYLFGDADLVGLAYHRMFAPAVADARDAAPGLHHLLVVDDASNADVVPGSVPYVEALADASPARGLRGPFQQRRLLRVHRRHHGPAQGRALASRGHLLRGHGRRRPPALRPADLGSRRTAPTGSRRPVWCEVITPPLMHVAAQWGAFQVLFGGGTVVLPTPGSLDAAEIWRLAERERAHVVTVVGDAMAHPLLEHLDALPAEQRPELSSLMVFASGGATLSPHAKATIARLLPQVIVIDGYGSTETGVTGSQAGSGTDGAARSGFRVDATTAVLDDELRPLAPGSGTVGRLARTRPAADRLPQRPGQDCRDVRHRGRGALGLVR